MTSISEETIRQKCTQEPWVRQKSSHIKFGAVPKQFEDMAKLMPEGSAERQSFEDAAEVARNIYREQAIALIDPGKLDPATVTQMCEKEPWTTSQRIQDLSGGTYGYVTEKLENARDLFAKDTPEYTAYDDAFEKAKILYFNGIKAMARQFATGRTRAQIEEVNSNLWGQAGRLEGNGTYLRSRLIKLCEWNGVYFHDAGKHIPRDPSVQQFKAK